MTDLQGIVDAAELVLGRPLDDIERVAVAREWLRQYPPEVIQEVLQIITRESMYPEGKDPT